MKKEIFLIILFFALAFILPNIHAATTGSVSPINPGHNSTQVFIPVGNNYINLQDAINYGYLLKANVTPVPNSYLPSSTPMNLQTRY